MSAAKKKKTPRSVDMTALVEAQAEQISELKQMMRDMEKRIAKNFHEQIRELTKHGHADPVIRARNAVIPRQAKRAGMTLLEWEEHCRKTGHSPWLMDRNIPNHEPKRSRGGGDTTKKRAKKRRK